MLSYDNIATILCKPECLDANDTGYKSTYKACMPIQDLSKYVSSV